MDKITRKESKRESKRRRSDGSENSFASATSLESFSSGSSGGSVSVDTSVPKTLWRFQERPPNSKQVRIGNEQAFIPVAGICDKPLRVFCGELFSCVGHAHKFNQAVLLLIVIT